MNTLAGRPARDWTLQVKMRFLRVAAIILLVLCGAKSHAQDVEIENIPSEVLQAVELGEFAKTYVVDGSLNPFYLRGDFDGDGKADYALRVKAKVNGAVGIAIWLSSQHKLIVLGAGKMFTVSGTSTSNLDFLNTWEVYARGPVERGVESGPPPHLVGDAILAGKHASASGLIYWNGKRFVWYQQGD
jgi:hypothetical protein